MGWMANYVGGPLHEEVEYVHGYWPFTAKKVAKEFYGYHLKYCVVAGTDILPETPIIYVWGGLSPTDAELELSKYLAAHATSGGVLEDYELSKVPEDLFKYRRY